MDISEFNEKIKENLSFLVSPILVYCVTLIWVIASNYYKNTLITSSLKDDLITSFFPFIVALLFQIKYKLSNK